MLGILKTLNLLTSKVTTGISLLTYAYTLPIFLKGFKKDFEQKVVSETFKQFSSVKLGNRLEKYWIIERTRPEPSLARALFKTFGKEFILFGFVLMVIDIPLKLMIPLALLNLIELHGHPNNKEQTEMAYICITIIIGASFLTVVLRHFQMHRMMVLGLKLQTACTALVYRKTLKLSKSASGTVPIGQITNLLSSDVAKFSSLLTYGHGLYLGPLQILIFSYVLYTNLGISSLSGIVFIILLIPLQVFCGKKSAEFCHRAVGKTDERIRLINEIVTGIQVIKMYTWEKPFTLLISAVRRLEVHHIRKSSYISGFSLVPPTVAKLSYSLSIVIHAITGKTVTVQYAFFAAAMYNSLREMTMIYLPRTLNSMGDCIIYLNRMQSFLLLEEVQDEAKHDLLNPRSKLPLNQGNVKVQNGVATWDKHSSTSNTLQQININVSSGELAVLVGPVGSGKTSILQIILNELPLIAGTLDISGSISYASQEPWIFDGTLQENILFGKQLVLKRYKEVLRVCALEQDVKNFPQGDKTIVGERGVMLSGGQRARVNLARAIYIDADIYLLDDPLSSVDTAVGKHVFDECIIKFLSKKCILFVTHNLQYIEKASQIILVESGKTSLSGTYDEIQKSGIDFTKLLESECSDENDDGNENNLQSFNSYKSSEDKVDYNEHRTNAYFEYFMCSGSLSKAQLALLIFILAQIFTSVSDYFIMYWVRESYFEGFMHEYISSECFAYIFAGMTALVLVFTLLAIFTFFRFTMNASVVLHDKLFSSIINAPMRFFTTTPTGRILNRFAKDIGVVDQLIPEHLFDFIHSGLLIPGVILVISLVNVWLLLAAAAIAIILYLMRIVYLPTGQSLKRLIGSTRSSIFSYMNESMHGLTTIRASRSQNHASNEFSRFLDINCNVQQVYVTCNRAFGFYIDMLCTVYSGIVIISLSGAHGDPASVGFAITQLMTLTSLMQWWFRQWGELESQMISVERILDYCQVKAEENSEKECPECWPAQGRITFSSASMKYSASDPYILKELNLEIKPNEKIGIVGRTGAGKSSLVWALFQLTPTEGGIFIDDVDITSIPHSALRSKISIIPQQPVLFSGTLRRNLDPFELYADTDLWNALECVQLKAMVSELNQGLDFEISEGGSNFSTGQKQLVCLARAIVGKRKILILDEATANVDPLTDILIQDTIKSNFTDCTVLTIAHRLNSIMDSDRVIVMDNGSVIEYDHPYVLLKDESGMFFSMVQQHGYGTAVTLANIAENSFKRKQHGS